MDTHELYDEKFKSLVADAARHDLNTEDSTVAMKNLRIFSECRPPQPQPESTPEHVPTTRWEKFKAGASTVWDNETTRTLIKAGGAFAGVVTVAYATINKDHVLERQAIAQANQSPVK